MSDDMKRTIGGFLKWVLAVVIAAAVIAILIVAYLRGRQEAAAEAQQEHPAAAASRVSTEAGQNFIALDSAAQSASGFETRALAVAAEHQQLRANAVVLSVQNLTQLRTIYLSELSQVDKAKAALGVSQQEYDRLKQLYEDNQNAAAKAVQAAEGTWHSDQVSFRAATEALQLNDTLARQTWGEVVAKWLIDGSPALDRILTQKDLLLQVSLLLGSVGAPPKTVSIQSPSGKIEQADFVSPYPAVDPRVQSPSFLYLAHSVPDLVPGMTLTVLLSTGPSLRGVIVPSSAIVWWQGKAWAYSQIASERFARREVSTEVPVPNGWFVAKGFAPGDKVVVRGGQQLLSEEFRSEIQSLYEGGGEAKN
jgi:hypothetical protein